MRHFDRKEWFLYFENKLEESKRVAMEEHLVSCDLCLNTYTSLILFEDERYEGEMLSKDFAVNIAAETNKGLLRNKGDKALNSAKNLQFYAVAAAVTLLLMTSGLFDAFVKDLPKVAVRQTHSILNVEDKISYGWSGKLLDQVTVRLDDITGIRRDGKW